MQLQVVGYMSMKGTNKAGKAYEMHRVYALTPIKSMQTASMTRDGGGFETVEVSARPGLMEKLQGIKLPAPLVFVTEQENFGGKLEVVLSDIAAGVAK